MLYALGLAPTVYALGLAPNTLCPGVGPPMHYALELDPHVL
jgi:hypothetical protein